MIYETSELIGPNDLRVQNWNIIELPSVPPVEGSVDRHIFGWSPDTNLWQLSSKINDEQEEYIETRSRKYFKIGPAASRTELAGVIQLTNFLQAWRVDSETIEAVTAKLNE
jgi:hypothetical protein